MHPIDWTILFVILALIVGYGIYKTRDIKNSESYFIGNRDLKWWTIGLSVMATQASAITFLSTPGQAYDEGMQFAQFYIGLPIAMVILSVFVLPLYYKAKIVTAYQFLEKRFGVKARVITAMLFLIQRGLAAGLTIFAPSIILSSILGWNLQVTTLIIGFLVIAYTVSGGAVAVSQTQKQQMIVILTGMFIAAVVIVFKLPKDISFMDTVDVAGKMGKLKVIDWEFDMNNKYTVWSGVLGGTFLFLSYFGTDQSQVQRYLSGKSLAESRLGLLFNGIFKVPMQISILFVGILVFMFFQFNPSPLHFNKANVETVKSSKYAEEYISLENELETVQLEKKVAIYSLIDAMKTDEEENVAFAQNNVNGLMDDEKALRLQAEDIIIKLDDETEVKLDEQDKDYVFISFITGNLPIGLIGLLLAVIMAAAMSSTSAELNALSTTTTVDIYKRLIKPDADDAHYLLVAKILTGAWGLLALFFASYMNLFENLIEAVNMIGSLFYGVILGIFAVAFFIKHVGGTAVVAAAVISQAIVSILFYLLSFEHIELPYLYLNPIGVGLVIIFSMIIQMGMKKKVV